MTEILPVRPSVVTSPPVSESNPSSAPPAEFSVRSDMPPSPTPVRDLVTAHLAEHPDEHPALLGAAGRRRTAPCRTPPGAHSGKK